MPGLKRKLTRVDFQQLADDRLVDAKALLAAGRAVAAYYMAGYAVECALKACIAKTIGQYEFPDKDFGRSVHTHDLPSLVRLAGVDRDFQEARTTDPALGANWGVVANWTETVRYYGASQEEAQALIDALLDADHGVLAWIQQHW